MSNKYFDLTVFSVGPTYFSLEKIMNSVAVPQVIRLRRLYVDQIIRTVSLLGRRSSALTNNPIAKSEKFCIKSDQIRPHEIALGPKYKFSSYAPDDPLRSRALQTGEAGFLVDGWF